MQTLFQTGVQSGITPRHDRRTMLGKRQTIGTGLMDSLVEFWPLSEPSGARIGSHNGTLASPTNTPSYTDGVPGSRSMALLYASGGLSNHLETSAGQQWGLGDTDFTVACWSRLDGAVFPYPFSGDVVGSAAPMYSIQGPYFYVSPTGVTAYFATAVGFTPALGVWVFSVGRHDSAGNLLTISVNNGLYSGSTPYSLGGNPSALGVITIGGKSGAYTRPGSVQFAGLWNRLLTADEESWLWNSGIGRNYPFI